MEIININSGWKFFKDTKSLEELQTKEGVGINLPHTWNAFDGQDGGSNYFRGMCFYEKIVDLNKKDDKDYYLEFRGVNAVAVVYVNGKEVTSHKGGFSTFRANVTDYVTKGLNTIQVSVDNTDFDDVYPETADFTFFGGIYRDVNFIEVNKSRFDLDYLGSEGIKVTPVLNEDGTASVTIESFFSNVTDEFEVFYDVLKGDEIILSDHKKALEGSSTITLDKPELWDGTKHAFLYTLNARLVLHDEVMDDRSVKFGIRKFKVDKDGFYLNGRKYSLHGVSRHQDRLNKGWAISKADHKEDIELIKEIGATTIRLAHYQHDQYFYDLCDEAGLVIWAEIPYISVHLPNGDENAISQMKELVIQNYNHPSICFWGISNEITIGGESEAQLNLHKTLEKLVKDLDKTRLTTLAAVTMCDTHSKLLDVPDIFSYNHYMGWYMGETKDNATWLDDFRAEFPDKPLGLSEYGCEAILSYHNSDPKCGDYSEEYQAIYHEDMLKIFEERPWLWSTHVWNMFDFGVDARDEGGVAGRNNKGLITYDRKTKKDSFYIYKAYWSDDPFIHICSKRYKKRSGKKMTVKVYSNLEKLDLYLNGKYFDTQEGKHIFTFEIPLGLFGAKVRVTNGEIEDEAKFSRVIKEPKSYKLKEEKKAVDNWFEKDGVKYEFKFPEGKFSIKDKFGAIFKTEEGHKVLVQLVAEALKTIDPNAEPEKFLNGAKKLVGGMSIERVAALAGNKISKEMLYHVNEELNKIDKPVK